MGEINEWGDDTQKEVITIADMTDMVMSLRHAREEYEAKKDASDAAHKVYEQARDKVLNALKSQGLTKFEVPGAGLVYTSTKEVYRVPKTNENKLLLFSYIKNKFGEDTLRSMLSINHQTLNSWANKESENGVMSIPGLESPEIEETVSLRRGR